MYVKNRGGKPCFKTVVNDEHVISRIRAVRYVLRANPELKVNYTRAFDWDDEDLNRDAVCEDYNYMNFKFDVRLKRHFLPCCLTEPVTSLLSRCRFVIRGVFIRNGRLPDGISELRLPLLLRRYLDLLED